MSMGSDLNDSSVSQAENGGAYEIETFSPNVLTLEKK